MDNCKNCGEETNLDITVGYITLPVCENCTDEVTQLLKKNNLELPENFQENMNKMINLYKGR